MQRSLGMVELISIPAGIVAGDAMMKAAEVELSYAQPVCAGKYIVIVTGEVAAVKASVEAGKKAAGMKLINELVIPSIDLQVPAAINGCTEIERVDAVGAVETYSLCSAVIAADQAVKAAEVKLIEVRLGRGMGGKSFITMTGDVAAVEAAIRAVQGIEEAEGLLSDCVIIPSPHPELAKSLL